MPLIRRQPKPPTRIPITCKVPEDVAAMLKRYAEFLESTQEYVITESLRLAFAKDKEFQTWLAASAHPAPPDTRP
jgi:predicted transcriptional regulator